MYSQVYAEKKKELLMKIILKYVTRFWDNEICGSGRFLMFSHHYIKKANDIYLKISVIIKSTDKEKFSCSPSVMYRR